MERTSAMNNREWLDKTCEDCEYRIDKACRRYPPSGTASNYPVVYSDVPPHIACQWRYNVDDIESHPIPARRKFPISIVIKNIIRNGGRNNDKQK